MKLIFAVLYVSRTMGLTRCYKTERFFTFIINNSELSTSPTYCTSNPQITRHKAKHLAYITYSGDTATHFCQPHQTHTQYETTCHNRHTPPFVHQPVCRNSNAWYRETASATVAGQSWPDEVVRLPRSARMMQDLLHNVQQHTEVDSQLKVHVNW